MFVAESRPRYVISVVGCMYIGRYGLYGRGPGSDNIVANARVGSDYHIDLKYL
jgi:hypothetical protein